MDWLTALFNEPKKGVTPIHMRPIIARQLALGLVARAFREGRIWSKVLDLEAQLWCTTFSIRKRLFWWWEGRKRHGNCT